MHVVLHTIHQRLPIDLMSLTYEIIVIIEYYEYEVLWCVVLSVCLPEQLHCVAAAAATITSFSVVIVPRTLSLSFSLALVQSH